MCAISLALIEVIVASSLCSLAPPRSWWSLYENGNNSLAAPSAILYHGTAESGGNNRVAAVALNAFAGALPPVLRPNYLELELDVTSSWKRVQPPHYRKIRLERRLLPRQGWH